MWVWAFNMCLRTLVIIPCMYRPVRWQFWAEIPALSARTLMGTAPCLFHSREKQNWKPLITAISTHNGNVCFSQCWTSKGLWNGEIAVLGNNKFINWLCSVSTAPTWVLEPKNPLQEEYLFSFHHSSVLHGSSSEMCWEEPLLDERKKKTQLHPKM
jgi:hypothetical protein